MVPGSSPPTFFSLETHQERYTSIHHTTTSQGPKKSVVDGMKGLGKIKVNDINRVVVVHHARHRFLEDHQIGETGPMG